MTITLERPEVAERVEPPKEPESHRVRRSLTILVIVVSVLAGGIAIAFGGTDGPSGLTQGQIADGYRLTAEAQSLGVMLTPGQQADADRWQARAEAEVGLSRSQQADADRLTGLANEFTRGRRADAERLQKLADSLK